jgi:hypothetical protein
MFLIENWSLDGQRKSVFETVYRTLGQSQRALRRVRTGGAGFWDDLKATPLERHLWARNAPYSLNDIGNPLKSQEMRAPSELVRWRNVLKFFGRQLA